MKNISRNKFLVCFRPVVDMDLMPSTTRSSVPDTEKSIMVHRPGKKTFSHVIKAVVFEILLAKRVKDRKGISRGSYSISKHNFPGNGHGYDEMLATSAGKVSAAEGIRESISESDSVPDSTPGTSKHQEREVNEKREGTHRSSSSSSSSSNAVFWLVISLAMTVFWGKTCAILFASIWLYFLPRLQRPAGDIENLESIKLSSEKTSKDYKKKVIMEGLLQRKQSRGAFNS